MHSRQVFNKTGSSCHVENEVDKNAHLMTRANARRPLPMKNAPWRVVDHQYTLKPWMASPLSRCVHPPPLTLLQPQDFASSPFIHLCLLIYKLAPVCPILNLQSPLSTPVLPRPSLSRLAEGSEHSSPSL